MDYDMQQLYSKKSSQPTMWKTFTTLESMLENVNSSKMLISSPKKWVSFVKDV